MKKSSTVEIVIRTLADLDTAVPEILNTFAERRKVAIYGEMGAGKTTLVRAFCRHLGAGEAAASPTFSLINEYSYVDQDGQPGLIHHLDLYRLKSAEEVYDIGIEEVLDDPWYCFIEWPEHAISWFPPEMIHLYLEVLDTEKRLIKF